MKNLAILVGAFLISTTTFAQKATTDNPFSLEGSMSLNNGLSWQAPTVRARYFVNDNIAVRASVGLGDGLGTAMSESHSFYENADGTGAVGTLDISRSSWNAQVGAEYHLSGTDRMSPYFSAGINFGGGSSTGVTTDTDGTMYAAGLAGEQTGSASMFGVGLGAGMDFYVFENIYVGVELGLNYGRYTNSDITTTGSMPAGGTTVTTTSVEPGSSASYLNTGAGNAAVRLGWRF